ncbi:MAG: hypothetical protein COB53_04945 [Elusimicrobia bacterium]|nr:MAG: hypothetical protein COB53_04945 [Elusimicrobiota bacterium]
MATVRVKRFPDEQDMILILLVLAVSFAVLRANNKPVKRRALAAPIGSSAAMDGLWRDSVAPLKKQDMRPQADPEMIWDQPRYERTFPKPLPPIDVKPEQPQTQPEPKPYFPTPRPVKEVFERPTLSPQRVSFAGTASSARTKAFLKKPEDEKKVRRRGY